MPLRSPRFYLSVAQTLLRASPTPSAGQDATAVRASHVHVQPYHARNTIFRVSIDVQITVTFIDVTGFTISDRIANTNFLNEA